MTGKARGETFYLLVGLYVAALGLFGFARNFYLRPFGATPLADAGPIYIGVVVHALLFTAWLVLAVWQPLQIRHGNLARHKRTGVATAWLAVGLIVTGIYVGGVQASRMVAAGSDAGFFAVPLIIMIGFAIAFGLAVHFRTRPDWHKRWIVVAHAQLLEPAAARALSTLDLPVFPPILLVISCPVWAGLIYDLAAKRRIPGIYIVGLILVLGSGALRHGLARQSWWIDLCNSFFGIF